jgi:hypothetical protein
MLQEIDQAETEYDFIFSVVIFLNLIFMGIETDYGDKDKTTGPWLVVESVFIVIYSVEFILRIRAVNRPLEEHEVQEREDRIRRHREMKLHREPTIVKKAAYGLTNMVSRGASLVLRRARTQQVAQQQVAPSPDGDEAGKERGINGDRRSTIERYNDDGPADANDVIQMLETNQEAGADASGTVQRSSPWFDPSVRTVRYWLIFDFLIVAVSILDAWILNFLLSEAAPSNTIWKGQSQLFKSLKILRILRVLRSVKLIRYVKDLYLLMNGFVYAFRTLGWVLFLLVLFNYVCALFAVRIFASEDDALRYFGDLTSSMYYLFVVLTLEKWPDIAESADAKYSGRWIFFVVYILVSHFMILNLFVAVIVENVTKASATADVSFLKELQDKKRETMKNLLELFDKADTDLSGTLTTEEFNAAMERGDGEKALKALEINRNDIDWLFDVLDVDGDNELSVDEFMEGMMALKSSEISRHMFQLQYAVVKELKKLEATIMRENPTAARTVVGDKKNLLKKKTERVAVANVGDEPLSPALLQPLDEANSWCLALKSTMETFASNVREVQSLAREASRETSTVEPSDEDFAKLAQDLEGRLESVSADLKNAKSQAESLFASTFLRSDDASPGSQNRTGGSPASRTGEGRSRDGMVPGSVENF